MKYIKYKVLHSLQEHQKLHCIISALFPVIILLLFPHAQSYAAETKKILVLHSYHQGLVWTDDIMEGIYSVFNKHGTDYEIHIEYMDTKRYFDGLRGKYLTGLRDMYKDKYGRMKLDMIISSDDNAFQFLLMYHDELFPGTPVVFSGVNNFEDAMLSGHDLFTGVIEFLDTKPSIDIALKLHPEAREIVIITDTTETGNANRKIIEQLAGKYKGRAEFVFIDKDNTGLTLEELLDRLRLLKKESVVFYSDFLRNRGKYIIQELAVPQISAASKSPIYTHYDEILGLGVAGGKLINGKSHGRKAAQMALQIVQGTAASKLPVYKESTGSYMFDYQQLKRFGIHENALPAGSVFINRPFSFYSQYKHLVWAVSGVFAFLVISLIAISLNVIKRKKAEEELRISHVTLEQKVEERTIALSKANLALRSEIAERRLAENALTDSERSYRTLAENLPGIVYRVFTREKNRIHFFNKASESLTGYKDYELYSGKICSIESCMHPEDRPKVIGELRDTIAANRPFSVEYRFMHKDGDIKYFIENGMPINGSDGKLLYIDGIILDITERKRAEEQIKASLEEKEVLLQEIHHRVKNNMAVISSLLRLQSRYVKDEQYSEMLNDSINRINTMALIHDKLYRSNDLARIDFNYYLDGMIDNMITSYGLKSREIALEKNVEDITLGIDVAIPCGLIVNELVSNALKHAFPGNRKGAIKVALHINKQDDIELSVRDDGIGIPEDFDFTHTGTLGMNLVNSLTKQLQGKIELHREKGTEFRIIFRRRE
ncbi:MAG: PAS domain-containing protein [Nitrospirae bacterium]|nr:PAS domain-containing protein [Nitrospirota bacterium]